MLWGERRAIAVRDREVSGTGCGPDGRTVRFSLVGPASSWARPRKRRCSAPSRSGPPADSSRVKRGGANAGCHPVPGNTVQVRQVPDTRGRPPHFRFAANPPSVGYRSGCQQHRPSEEVYDDRHPGTVVTRLTGPGVTPPRCSRNQRQVRGRLPTRMNAYRRVGVDTVLIRGFRPLDDVVEWAETGPLLARRVAARHPGRPRAGPAESALSACLRDRQADH